MPNPSVPEEGDEPTVDDPNVTDPSEFNVPNEDTALERSTGDQGTEGESH